MKIIEINNITSQWGQTNPDIFSITPKIGRYAVLQKLSSFLTSESATP